ncbi:esterase family protein [Verrucomicrobiales bacterium]|nr:esterase family protein [Verrucomicrobiales bacterium]MDA7926668.1 esterase family protein [Verrucomicrobiales bacterium]
MLKFTSALIILATAVSGFAQENTPKKKPAREPHPASITWLNELPEKKTLPPNTTHRTFHSEAANTYVGYCLYLPPGYEENTDRRYPVIYNLHGNGGNEFHSFEDVTVLHEGILSGKWPPMIMALPNGGTSTFYKDSHDGKFPIETIFMTEFIPHIDAEFRTIASGAGRCIEGFSMGGRGSLRLAMKYPDMFCSLFCQAGNVPATLQNFDDAADWNEVLGGFLGPDRANYESNDAFVLLEKNLKKIKNGLRIQIACGTKDGGHLPTIRNFHDHLVEHGIDHTYIELEGLAHKRTEMIQRLEPIWFDYHVESLREAAEASKQ